MQQTEYIFQGATGELHYLFALPRDYDNSLERRWPMLLFLHGRGERGTDLGRLKRHGIPKLLETAADFPFITVSPQCPPDTDWEPFVDTLLALLDEIITSYAVDPQRVYLTGLSMGARGSWLLGATAPHRFAAVLPICGHTPYAPDFYDRLPNLKATPVWVFHGALDTVVPVEHSDRMVAALQAAGGNVRYTIYTDAHHDAWTRTYDNPAVFEWLLAHSLTPSPSGRGAG